MQMINNIFSDIPTSSEHELFETLLERPDIKIERVISYGQSSPEEGWYDQAEDEWVLVVQGAAVIFFEDGERIKLEKGGHLLIARHRRHRVAWTDPSELTIWLAVFYGDTHNVTT